MTEQNAITNFLLLFIYTYIVLIKLKKKNKIYLSNY